jgi:hypothetical protein
MPETDSENIYKNGNMQTAITPQKNNTKNTLKIFMPSVLSCTINTSQTKTKDH